MPHEFTEEQYAVITNQTKLHIAQEVLREILCDTDGVIFGSHMEIIIKQLFQWEEKLSNKIHVEGDAE